MPILILNVILFKYIFKDLSFKLRFNKNHKKRIIHYTWMTTGIKTSCKHKRELCLALRDSKDIKLRRYHKLDCKVLSNVIREAK
jgi:hypothetical protein